MDPSFPSAVPGDVVGAADSTLDAPPDDCGTASLSVVAETFAGGVLTPEAILGWGDFADDLAYQGIALLHPAGSRHRT